MPGTTPLGLRYPYPWETVTADSFQNLAEDIDTVLDGLDVLRLQARVPAQASVLQAGAGNNVTVAVGTGLTWDTEVYDTAGLVNLGVNNDRFTLSTGLWFCTAWANTSGGTTTTGTHLQFNVAGVLHTFHRIDNSSITGKNISAQALIPITAAGTILQLVATWTGTGGPQVWTSRMQAWKVRDL